MRFLFSLLLTGVFLCVQTKASNTFGARASALAGNAVTQIDVFAAANNPAAAAFLTRSSIGFYYQNKYLFAELNEAHTSFVFLRKIGTFSSSLGFQGYKAFNETNGSFSYSRKFGSKISAGLGIKYHHLAIQENGSKNLISAQISLYYQALERLDIGLTINNPIKQKISPNSKESLSSFLALGLAYHPSEQLLLALQVSKDLKYPFNVCLGIEYEVHKLIKARLGLGMNPFLVSGGIGFQLNQMDISVSSSWDQQLGFSPQLSLAYDFGK